MTDQIALEEGTELNLQFDKRGGLLPVIVQDKHSREILMLGYINAQAWLQTLRTGYATFWSTSRSQLWTKGETSGDYLKMHSIRVDCDQDAVIYLVEPLGGGVCHTKNTNGTTRFSCFYRSFDPENDRLILMDANNEEKSNGL